MSRFVFVVLLVLSSSLSAFAQNLGNSCQLTVRVRTMQDSEYNLPLQVELLSEEGTPILVAQTSGTGSADFSVTSGATYRVRVSGQGIETTTADFRIPDGQQVYTETVNAKASSSNSQQQNVQGSSPTISLAEMNVPDKAREELQKGMEAFAKGDMAKAQERFEKAVAIYPQYARAYSALGIIAAKAADHAKAKTMFSKAIEVDHKFVPAYLDLARMDFQDKNYPEAESLLQKAMLLNPSIPDVVALLASAEYMNKEYDKALVDAQRVHRLPNHEQFAQVHLLAGKILEMQGHMPEAIAEYQLFLKENPNSPQAAAVQQEITQLQAGKN